MRITGSLVLYNNSQEQYEAAIQSFLNACDGRLHVIDNSPQALQSKLFAHECVTYLHTGKNLGFGAGHNVALRALVPSSDFHLILNPDVVFERNVINILIQTLMDRPNAGAIMPRILYPDGSLQKLCKLLPAPHHLFLRRFIGLKSLTNAINRSYELHELPQTQISCVPSLSGCFLLIRSRHLKEIGLFDENYFMYMEDVDLVRRIGDVADTIYQPVVSVKHGYAKGSYNNPLLLKYHIRSAVYYFRKWGWFFDSTRRSRNTQVLKMLFHGNNKAV